MKKVLLFFLLFTAVFAQAQEQADPYEKTLQEVFRVTGSEEAYASAIKGMMNMYRSRYTDIDPEIWNGLEKEFLQNSIADLARMLSPVYRKYLTLEDLNGIIAFYNTPVGKKYASYTGTITAESMEIGQQWGMQIGQAFAEKLAAKGL